MKLFKPKKVGVSRNYVLFASAYKKLAQKQGIDSLDFSADSLLQQYEHESYGRDFYYSKYGEYRPNPKSNGYTYGKHLYDINLTSIIEDLSSGDFCKIEYLKDYSIPAIMRKQIAALPCAEFFAWRIYYDNIKVGRTEL